MCEPVHIGPNGAVTPRPPQAFYVFVSLPRVGARSLSHSPTFTQSEQQTTTVGVHSKKLAYTMARSFFVGIACLCFATARGQNSDWEHVRPAPPSASTTPDEEAPFVGITNLRAACADATEEGCMKKLKKLEAVDADPYVTGESCDKRSSADTYVASFRLDSFCKRRTRT